VEENDGERNPQQNKHGPGQDRDADKSPFHSSPQPNNRRVRLTPLQLRRQPTDTWEKTDYRFGWLGNAISLPICPRPDNLGKNPHY
jgi:hypothetical protein